MVVDLSKARILKSAPAGPAIALRLEPIAHWNNVVDPTDPTTGPHKVTILQDILVPGVFIRRDFPDRLVLTYYHEGQWSQSGMTVADMETNQVPEHELVAFCAEQAIKHITAGRMKLKYGDPQGAPETPDAAN